MSAWRLLDEDRKLRRPAGSPEAAGELPDDLVSGLALEGVDIAGSRRERLTLLDSVLRRCELTAAVWQQVTVRQTELVLRQATFARFDRFGGCGTSPAN